MEIEPRVARLIAAAEKGRGLESNKAVEDLGIVGAMYQNHLRFNDNAMAGQIGINVQDWENFKCGVLRGKEFAKVAAKFLVYMNDKKID